MKRVPVVMTSMLLLLCGVISHGQTMAPNTNLVVPPVIQFSNVATDAGGNPITGTVEITFSLFNNSQGGESLWSESQNVPLDNSGHYSVYVGITKPNGVPMSLFTSGEARWLGVQIAGQTEQARVFLVSVPYAMKAGDAETIGGLPPSAFVLAVPPTGTGLSAAAATASAPLGAPPPSGAITGTGTVNFVPLWDTTSDIISSVIFQSGSGTTAKIGIGSSAPASTLDIKGGSTVRGTLSLPATGMATATAGKNSQPLDLAASVFNSTTSTAVPQTFQWQAEPAGNDTATASGTLNLLFGSDTTKPAETGLHIANTGQITFATGQTFPGTGNGTVTSVASGLGLTGGPITGSGALSINTAVVPQLASANTFTGNQAVNGNLTATQVVSGASFEIGSNLFGFGSYANQNAFLGFSGNTTTTGTANIAGGYQALNANTTGYYNAAWGAGTLHGNTAGNFNTALGTNALWSNTTGYNNTAIGYQALSINQSAGYNVAVGAQTLLTTTGQANTGVGNYAGNTVDGTNLSGINNTALGTGAAFSTGNLTNATAIGANAQVAASNAMVLGSISGVNGSTADTHVGIGTTTPATKLDVAADSLHTYIGGACGTTGFGGIAFGSSGFQACANYSLMGDGTSTYINAPDSSLGSIYFRLNNQLSPSAMMIGNTVLGLPLVGIGTNSPDNTLTVNGTADKPGGGSWGTFSDRRLKDLNGEFNAGLAQVLKLQPIRYRYKDENAMGIHDREEHVGFIAQEVQKVIPEAVTENSKGYLLVNNDPILWTMLNAIKEQQALIRKQNAQIARLSSEVNAIRASLKTSVPTNSGLHAVTTPALVAHPESARRAGEFSPLVP